MSHSPRLQARFEPRDPNWETRARAVFTRQPLMAYLGATVEALRPGYCEIHVPYKHELTQHNGFFHAGVVAAVVDNAGGGAGATLMPPGADVLTVEFKLNLLAPGVGDLLIAEGHVVKPGKNLVIVRGEVYVVKDGVATHCATMQQTLMTMHSKN